MPGPDRNTRNFNRETENAVERSMSKEYDPGRPITATELAEDIRKKEEALEEAKANGTYISPEKKRALEDEKYIEHRNKDVELFAKLKKKAKYGE